MSIWKQRLWRKHNRKRDEGEGEWFAARGEAEGVTTLMGSRLATSYKPFDVFRINVNVNIITRVKANYGTMPSFPCGCTFVVSSVLGIS